jgi:hypothetical protein
MHLGESEEMDQRRAFRKDQKLSRGRRLLADDLAWIILL